MNLIEQKISSLIASQFPAFYQEEGPNFIAFVKAYYEWLEQNFQLIELENAEGFAVGDKIAQGNVTGSVYVVDGNDLLVLVDGLETFKCFNVCSELIPVTSSSGGNSLIKRGGTQRRLGTLFLSRNLLEIGDIDKTIDLFVVRFKEKYLKNIEFDTQTNKRLLIKNSLDLYRSKGTSRSIDLFFRLIYGIRSEVYYPGDDLFRLSDGEWFRPQYIEINPDSVERAISLVGKQVTGVNTGSTAFVERYVKRKVNGNVVHLLYVSNVRGSFEVTETLKSDQIFNDSPTVLGSLTQTQVIDGASDFEVGDQLVIESRLGASAKGRVSSITRGSGEVRFDIADGGWGFTTNVIDNNLPLPLQSLMADTTLTINDVKPGARLQEIVVTVGGSGYSNTDIIRVGGAIKAGEAAITTDGSGAIVSTRVIKRGALFDPTTLLPSVIVVDEDGNPSSGSDAEFNPSYRYANNYLQYLEYVEQKLFRVSYITEVGITDFVPGTVVSINGNRAVVVANNIDISEIIILVDNSGNVVAGQTIVLTLPDEIERFVVVDQVQTEITAGKVVGIQPAMTLTLDNIQGVIQVGQTIYQRNSSDGTYVTARVTSIDGLFTPSSSIIVTDVEGVFRPGMSLLIDQSQTTATLGSIQLEVDLAQITGDPFNDENVPVTFTQTGITGIVTSKTGGVGAQYRVASLSNATVVSLNTDTLDNPDLLNTRLNDTYAFFPRQPGSDSSSVIYGALSYTSVPIGTISTLGGIRPGTGYSGKIRTSVFQRGVQGYHTRDLVLTFTGNQSQFFAGEQIVQNNEYEATRFVMDTNSGLRVGERIEVVNAGGVVVATATITDIVGANTIETRDVSGVIPTIGIISVRSLITPFDEQVSDRSTIIRTDTARGEIVAIDGNQMTIRQLQLMNKFRIGRVIVGQQSATVANVSTIADSSNRQVAGFNATIDADASIAGGVIDTIEISDSGFGYNVTQEATYYAANNRSKTGTINVVLGGVGYGVGEYRNRKGFLSDISKIHDGDYYQEYSYDILTRLPLDRYGSMFKNVMHTAGTRFFGSVLVETLAEIGTRPAVSTEISSITISDSPYAIVDRQAIDVEDRNDIVIEIRE